MPDKNTEKKRKEEQNAKRMLFVKVSPPPEAF